MLAFDPENDAKLLDSVGLQILEALQENARTPFAEIGRRVNLTAPAVAERVRRMEEAGIITGYHAHVNTEKLGLPISVLIRLALNGPCTPDTAQYIAKVPNVTSYYYLTGDDDFVILAAFQSLAQLDQTLAIFNSFGTTSTTIVFPDRSMPYRPVALGGEGG